MCKYYSLVICLTFEKLTEMTQSWILRYSLHKIYYVFYCMNCSLANYNSYLFNCNLPYNDVFECISWCLYSTVEKSQVTDFLKPLFAQQDLLSTLYSDL